MRAVALLVAALLAAGCLTALRAPEGALPRGAPDLAALYAFEHDHLSAEEHAFAWNFTRVAWHSLTEDGAPLGLAGEIDVALERDLAVVHLEGVRSGLAVVDVADPTAPRLLGYADAEAYRPFEGRDAKIDPRGEYAYFALQLAAPGAPGSPAASGGFLVISLADSANPQIVAQGREAGRGCHMIRYWEAGDTRVVYCASSQGLAIYRLVDGPEGPRTPVKVGNYVPRDGGRTVERAGAAASQPDPVGVAAGALTLFQPHDMTAQLDPLTGSPVLVSAQETYGIKVLDISEDPTRPVEIASWDGEGAEHFARIHTALLAKIGDRRVAVGVTETLDDSVPAFYLVDMTDYAAPKFLAEWVPPGEPTSRGILFSTHNVQVVGNILYMAHFHAGVWAFDVSDPASPRPVAVYAAREAAVDEASARAFAQAAPIYWDVVVHKGYVLATDIPSGLVVLQREGDPAGDAAWRSFV